MRRQRPVSEKAWNQAPFRRDVRAGARCEVQYIIKEKKRGCRSEREERAMEENLYAACRYRGEKVFREEDGHDLKDLEEIVAILRTHCPWDREQDLESLKKTLSDETEEVMEAIDGDDADNLCEELGDLLFQIVFMARLAEEKGLFTLDDVVRGIGSKMVRRHPHVFGDQEVKSREEIRALWGKVKAAEKEKKAGRARRSLKGEEQGTDPGKCPS
jgi:tetrapyrrole methylase family protein/MazG family protein